MIPVDISIPGLNSIRMEEGRALRAYQDSVGVWTVGYGLTNMDKGLPWRVQRGLVITEQEAEWFLYHSLKVNYEPDVRRAIDFSKVSRPQGAFDGGLGFHFNTGGILRASWPKLLVAGNLAAAQTNLSAWCKAGGRVLTGLVRRRAHEWSIISAENYGHLSGPTIVMPGANNQEVYGGHADLLTMIPMPPNHSVSPQSTAAAAIVPSAANAPGILRPGDQGSKVVELQHKINASGGAVPVTGVYDAATEEAVRKFQRAHPNLTADGNAGPATLSSFDRAAQMKQTVTTAGKVAGPSIPTAYIAFHQFVSAHAGEIALYTGLAVVAGLAAYLLWHYRHDLHSKLNHAIGRVVA